MSSPMRSMNGQTTRKPNKKVIVAGSVVTAGVVYWAYKRNAAANSTTTATDPGIDPTTGQPYDSEYYDGSSSAVGTSPSAYGYTDPFGNTIVPGTGQTVVTAPSTNAAWGQQAALLLINEGQYDPTTTFAAIGIYVGSAGKANLTDDQYAIVQAAYGVMGNPPQPIDPPHVAPPSGQNTGGVTGGIAKRHYVTEVHQISVATQARDLVRRYSDPAVTNNNTLQVALVQTMGDPRNSRYLPYYGSHAGQFPAKAKVYLHVVKAG